MPAAPVLNDRATRAADWIRSNRWSSGIELLEARLETSAYTRHRHDTYAIGLTVEGVQAFDYAVQPAGACPGRCWCCTPTNRTTATPTRTQRCAIK